MNLIEQQNILRGLPDDALPKLMETGETPPFLVLSEIGRRKTARERYEGNRAKYAQNNTSVAEDLIGSKLSRPGIMQRALGAPAASTGGLDALAPGTASTGAPGGLDAAMPAFSGGGLVQHFDGGGYVKTYEEALAEKLAAIPAQRDRARALAIIAAGTGMMGGKSSNTLTNVGQGLAAALPVYQRGIETADTTEMDLLRQQFDVGRTQHQDELEALDRKFREEEAKRDNERAERGLMPANVQEALWYKNATEEEKASYDHLNSVKASKFDKEAEAAYNSVYRQTERKFINADGGVNFATVPEDVQQLLADPATAAQGQAALKRLIKEEALAEYTARYPSYAEKALEYQTALEDAPAPSSEGGGTLWSDYFKKNF